VTESASRADIHLQPRPGTDCALILSMLNVIVNEALYDAEFVDRWCYGFDQLRKRLQDYSPEKVAETTWVESDKIRSAARMYATTKPAIILHGMGIEHLNNNVEFIHARYILESITGNLNVDGGIVLTGPHSKLISENELALSHLLPPEQRKKQIGADRFKVITWPGYELIQDNIKRAWGQTGGLQSDECVAIAPLVFRAIISGEPYPIRAIITFGSNPMLTKPHTKLVYRALNRLDLYVVHDMWMTPSAELADYVLPAASWLEKPRLFTASNNLSNILAGERALPTTIPGEYDRRTEFEIWKGLGMRLGQAKYWPWMTDEDVYDYRLKPLGCTLKNSCEAVGLTSLPLS